MCVLNVTEQGNVMCEDHTDDGAVSQGLAVLIDLMLPVHLLRRIDKTVRVIVP